MFSNEYGVIAVPIIIGGIAGLTLSITAIERIYSMSKEAFCDAASKQTHFFIKNHYSAIISETINLSALFVFVELFAFLGYSIDVLSVILAALFLLILNSIYLVEIFDNARALYTEPPGNVKQIYKEEKYADSEDQEMYLERLKKQATP
jgi:hypothetical protein